MIEQSCGCVSQETGWVTGMRTLLGLRVEVTYSHDGAGLREVGWLHRFSDDGEVVLIDEMGFSHWIWPCLEINEVLDDAA